MHLIEVDGNDYYLVDFDNDMISDKLYSPLGKITNVQYVEDNKYLLDIDDDKEWDYIYDSASDSISIYSEKETPDEELPWIFIIIGIIALVVIAIVGVLYKAGYIHIERYKK